MIDLFGLKDARIRDLEERIAALEKSNEKLTLGKERIRLQIAEFKKFSPKLWFEYFSQDSGKFSAHSRAQAKFDKWLNDRRAEK
jgi:hypothetical protein